MWWEPKWSQSIKMSQKPPDWHPAGHNESRLADGTVIIRDGFLVKDGDHPEKFFDAEPGLRSALTSAGFCSVTGWPVQGARPGERHPATLAVWHAAQGARIPTTPEAVTPPAGRSSLLAETAVLAWITNRAFEEQRLKRPEVVSVEPLTTPRSRRHIWKIQVRFYGGVTLADVRKKALNLTSAFGVPWLRVMPAEDGCVIVAGCEPDEATLARPDVTAGFLESLDLEQAFVDAGVVGRGGLTPTLLDQGTMPRNPEVRVLDYALPAGLEMARVRGALGALRTNTNMEFLSPGPGVHGAASMRMLMARGDPMPQNVGFDWDHDYASGQIAFGAGIDGEYVTYEPKVDPHLMLVGSSGAGKSASAQNLITGLLLSGAHVAVVDVQKKCADFRFAQEWTMAQATTVPDALAVMEAAYAEVKRRAELNGQHGVGSTRDLPAHLRPRAWFVAIDEYLGLITTGARPSSRAESDPELEAARQAQVAEYQARKRIAFLSDRIGAEARSADVHLVMMTQKLVVSALPPEAQSLKVNMARIILGKTTYGDRQSALREPDEAPDLGDSVPKGRGIWESMEARPIAVHFFFATQEEYAEGLRAAGVDPAPALDLATLRPVPPSERAKFAVIKSEAPVEPFPQVDPAPAVAAESDWDSPIPLVNVDEQEIAEHEVGESLDLDFDDEFSMDDVDLDAPEEPEVVPEFTIELYEPEPAEPHPAGRVAVYDVEIRDDWHEAVEQLPDGTPLVEQTPGEGAADVEQVERPEPTETLAPPAAPKRTKKSRRSFSPARRPALGVGSSSRPQRS